MEAGEFAVVDNGGFVSTGFKNQQKALKEIKDMKKDQNFQSKGRLTVVKIVGSFDNFMHGNAEYLGENGMPIAD